MNELTISPPQELTAPPPVAQMMQAVIEKGITTENVAALTQLTALYERMQEKDAERQFAASFVALQQELPVITASTDIPKRGKYERFEDVMRVIQPLLTKHGFTTSFSQDTKEDRITQTCQLRHTGGHSQSNSFSVRTGRADDATQADCKASTTAKRNALLNCLNIVIRQDALQDEEGDARLEGELVDAGQVAHLRKMVSETGANEAKFLVYAGAPSYEQISASKFDRLVDSLKKKARQ